MPLHCPRCRIFQADANETCINCGQPLPPPAPALPDASFADPERLAEANAAAYLADHDDPAGIGLVHVVQVRRASWKMPALIAVGVLLALLGAAALVNQRKAAFRAAPPVTVLPPASALLPPALPLVRTAKAGKIAPLRLTLTATQARRRIPVGSNVTLTLFTTHAQGRSAVMTLFCRRLPGQKRVLALAQGSLCTTTWAPQMPGQYELSATAAGGRLPAAAARPLIFTVSAAPPQMSRQAAVMPPERPRVAAPVLTRNAQVSSPARRTRAGRLTYHIEAARFPFARNADVLAAALRRQGIPAVAQHITDRRGKPVYIVETGTTRRLGEVRRAVLGLQRSGYPAYFYGTR